MATGTLEILNLLYRPEYMALLISVIAITANVYISWRNRKYALAKEEYFKLQRVAEKIIGKLLIFEKQRLKLKHFFELSFEASRNTNSRFIDTNDTFNRADFEKEGEEIATFIYLYFSNLEEDWNFCMDKMSDLFTHVFVLDKHIEVGKEINWEEEAEAYNKASRELGAKPSEMADKLKGELKKFKENNL